MPIALTHLASLALALPLALDGEAETAGNVGLGVISIVSVALTYIGLFALWYFVFRDSSRSRRKKESSD